MSSEYHEIRSIAAHHGLRELCSDSYPESETFTHLATEDGTYYQLASPMTSRDLNIAADAKHHLLIIIPENERPLASVSVYVTARVLRFYDEITYTVDKAFCGAMVDFTRPWVQTQNQRYFLVKKD